MRHLPRRLRCSRPSHDAESAPIRSPVKHVSALARGHFVDAVELSGLRHAGADDPIGLRLGGAAESLARNRIASFVDGPGHSLHD
jgi:hypothetical protein